MYSIALLGLGRISKKHLDSIIALPKKFNLIAVCDKDKKKLNKFKMKNVKKFNDMNSMVKISKPDVISVLTESGNHINHYLKLSKRVKYFIIEKPLALFKSDLEIFKKSKKKNKNKIFVVKQNRYNPPLVKLKKAINKNLLGKIFMSTARVRWMRDQNYYNLSKWRGTRKLDGGVIGNQASHHLDALIWLNGNIKEVFAYGIKALAKIESEDTIIANLKFTNGSIGLIEATTATRPCDIEGSISILGSHGIIEVGGFAMNKIKIWKTKKQTLNKFKENYNIDNVYGFGHKEFYKNVFNSLNRKKNEVIKIEEAIHVSKVIEAINTSIKTGKKIKIK